MALDALAAGKDVALEKPIARTIKDSLRLIAAVNDAKRVFRVDSEFRSLPYCHRATSLARNGYLGKITSVDVVVPIADKACPPQQETEVPDGLDYRRWLGPAEPAPYAEKRVHPRKSFDRPGWFSLLAYSDGVVTNWGAHLNGGAMWTTDKERTGPTEISGIGSYLPRDSFSDTLAEFDVLFRFADGLTWRYRTGETPSFRVSGEAGWAEATFHAFDASSESLKTVDLAGLPRQFPLLSEKADFISAVRSRGSTLEPIEVGHRVNSLGKLGHICVHLGRTLTWDPAAEEFPGDDEANALRDNPILARPAAV